jgi:hypothetical protein
MCVDMIYGLNTSMFFNLLNRFGLGYRQGAFA